MLNTIPSSYISLDEKGNKKTIDYTLTKEQEALANRAIANYEVSKKWIHQKYAYIWMYAHKAYHLDTEDRAKYLKTWQSNIAWGLIRAFIDVFISTLTERPVSFSVTGLNEKGVDNQDFIKYMLTAIADATNLQKESRHAMKEGLKTGTFAFFVGMLPKAPTLTVELPTNDNANPVETHTYENQIGHFPYAKSLDVFNVFPDVYKGSFRYCAWRQVTSFDGFYQQFASMIESSDNESPLKSDLSFLTNDDNATSADKSDYSNIVDLVHQQKNYHFSTENQYQDIFSQHQAVNTHSTVTHDRDSEVTSGLIEYIFYAESDKIVIYANRYPVYIGKNPYGFIPFVLASTTDETQVLGCEGVPYLLSGMEKTLNSYMNNYLDNVKVAARKILVARKGLFSDEDAIENAAPGDVLYSETDVGANSLQVLDTGVVSDYNILDIVIKIASQLTGISEYNLGISARERTATGANATTQSSQKRLSPFLEVYMSVISRVAYMMLRLAIMHMSEKEKVYTAGDSEGKYLSAKDLLGTVLISLNTDSMFAVIKDFTYKKLLEVQSQTRGSGLNNEAEVMREIWKSQGYDPERFVMPDAPAVTTPPSTTPTPISASPTLSDTQIEGYDLANAVTPNIDLGNGGEGQQ